MSATPSEHDFYDPVPIVARAPLRWPNGARLAFAIVVSIEFYELRPAPTNFIPPNLPGGFGRGPYPDLRNYTHREYGPRVGLFRLAEIFEQRGLPVMAALDARTVRERPFIADYCRKLGWEIAAHGRAVTDVVSDAMPIEVERAYIQECLATIEQATGIRPRGWHGAEYGESRRTPQLLADAGLDYVLDWPNDEQPYDMRCGAKSLVAVPMQVEFDDVIAHWQRKLTMARWRDGVIEAVERLRLDGETSGRVLVLNLHPWLAGQPFRATYVEEIADHVRACADVWWTSTGEIARAYHAILAG